MGVLGRYAISIPLLSFYFSGLPYKYIASIMKILVKYLNICLSFCLGIVKDHLNVS